MRLFESIKHHRKITTSAAAVVLGVGGVEMVGYAQNPTFSVSPGSCISPMAVSETHVDPDAHLLLETYTGINTTGVIARGVLPEGARGVVASFKSPDAGTEAWNNHASRMLKANSAGEFAVKLAVGPGEVEFGIGTVAPEGSPLCDTAPAVSFTYKDVADYRDTHALLPWPNPVNAAVNIPAAH